MNIDLSKCFPEGRDGSRKPLPKQQLFIDKVLDPSGPKYVGYYGGVGCLRGSTLIDTPLGKKRIDEIGPSDRVLSMSSSGPVWADCSVPYPKGKGRLYRVVHERGEFVGLGSHLIYVASYGYLSLDALSSQHAIACVSEEPPPKDLEADPLLSPLDAQHWKKKASDWLAYCSAYFHRYGQLPQASLNTARVVVPLLADALQYNLSSEDMDALAEPSPRDNRLVQFCSLLDKLDSLLPSEPLAASLGHYISALSCEQNSDQYREVLQSQLLTELHRIMPTQPDDFLFSSQAYTLSLVISVEQLDFEETYYDISVPSTGNYIADGVIHHNSGKSLILCYIMLAQGLIHGGEYTISRQFMPELRRTTYKNFLEIVPKELILEHRVADAELHIRAAAGKAIFYFVALEEPKKILSMNLSGFGIDEASQTSEEGFLILQSRLRNPKGLRKGILVGNPMGHDWVYRYFIKQDAFKSPEARRQYYMIVAPSTENVHLPDGYVQSMLESYSSDRIQREILGSFDAFEGQVYHEFDRQVHVIKPFRVPPEWTRFVGIDHGYRNPAAAIWCAIDYDENIYVYREFYQREWIVEQIVNGNEKTGEPGLVALNKGDKLSVVVIDPSTKADRGRGSDYTAYLEHLPRSWPFAPANNDVTPGIDRVKSYLKVNDATGKPRLYIFETCTNIIEEITQYRYEATSSAQQMNKNEKETPVKKNDHAVDALRYAVMTRPDAPISAKKLDDVPYPTPQSLIAKELKQLRHPKQKDPFQDY